MVQMKDGGCASFQRNVIYLMISGEASARRSLGSWVKPRERLDEVAVSSSPEAGKPPAALCSCDPTTPKMFPLSPCCTWHTSEPRTADGALRESCGCLPPAPGSCHWRNRDIIQKEGEQEEKRGWDNGAGVEGQSVKQKRRPENRA